jgi:hypothetical protein
LAETVQILKAGLGGSVRQKLGMGQRPFHRLFDEGLNLHLRQEESATLLMEAAGIWKIVGELGMKHSDSQGSGLVLSSGCVRDMD